VRKTPRAKNKGFLHHHSLGIASLSILALWIVLYIYSDAKHHWGAFFGNAIADWTGVVFTVFATKYMYEKGSAESRRPKREPVNPVLCFLYDHSLVIFLVLTGAVWTALFVHASTDSKWGEVAGNIVSEWTQLIGLVILTKKLIEAKSKE
jgi:hypothetical protein